MTSQFDREIDRRGTACIKWDFQEADYGRSGLIPFSIADADYMTYPPIMDALKRRIDQGVIGYTDLDEDYYSAVAGWCLRRHQWKIEHDWIVPTGGIVPAMCNAIEALLPMDAAVAVQPPVYDPFYSVIHAAGRKMVKNDLLRDESGYHMDYEGLEAACKNEGVRMILLCNPHNPVCRVWSREELQRLADICKKYDLYVVSDEIHWDLVLFGNQHVTMGSFPELYEKLIVCTSCSKTFNIAGLETSNLIIPGKAARETFRGYLFARYLFCPNTLGLEAVKAAYAGGDAWVDAEQAHLTGNAAFVRDYLARELPRVKLAEPEGTYLLWMDMTDYGLTSDELIRRIAEAGAGLNSGAHYGSGYDGFVRMNVACPRRQLEAGLACVKQALDQL